MTRTNLSTPERFLPDFCSVAQSSGECPGERSTLFLAFGVSTDGRPEGGSPKLPFELGGPRFGIGPRFGNGPVLGTRIDCVVFGRARRFDAATRGGGINEDDVGFIGGAIRLGFGGGAILGVGARPPALCAEFRAGNEGGGKLSSSSSSSSSSEL